MPASQVRRRLRLAERGPQRYHARPRLTGDVLGRVLGPPLGHPERPLLDRHREHHRRRELLVRRRTHLGEPARDQLLDQHVEGGALLGAGQDVEPAEDDCAAVLERRLEGRPGHHDRAQRRDRDAGVGAPGELPQPARAGRAVDQEAVVVAGHARRHDDRAAVADQADVGDVLLVDQRVELAAVADGLLGHPGHRGVRHDADPATRGAGRSSYRRALEPRRGPAHARAGRRRAARARRWDVDGPGLWTTVRARAARAAESAR